MPRDKSQSESEGKITQNTDFPSDLKEKGSTVANLPEHMRSPIDSGNGPERANDLADYSPEELLSFYSAVAS